MPTSTTNHKTRVLTHPTEGPIDIDEDISQLIWLLWHTGHDTLFCCQGDEGVHNCYEGYERREHTDPYCWSAKSDRAYILMPRNTKTFRLTQRIMRDFLSSYDGPKILWDFEFDDELVEFGQRICWRFPKGDIDRLTRFLQDTRTETL